MTDRETTVIIVIVCIVFGAGLFYGFDGLINGIRTQTTQAAGKIIYYSIGGQQVTMVIQDNAGNSQTSACPLGISHQQNSPGLLTLHLFRPPTPRFFWALRSETTFPSSVEKTAVISRSLIRAYPSFPQATRASNISKRLRLLW